MRIALLALPHAKMLDVAGLLDVFSEAAVTAGVGDLYRSEVIGIDDRPVVGPSGLRILPHRTISDRDEPVDTLLVVGSDIIETFARDPKIQTWLRRQMALARRYGAICNGAFALAAAELLDGCRHAVTRLDRPNERPAWWTPTIELNPTRTERRPMHTLPGVPVGVDLALALVEQDLGRDLALRVARKFVAFRNRPRPEPLFDTYPARHIATISVVGAAQNWVLENISANHTVDSLARRAGMSLRNFSRVFRRETGTTPADFIEVARIDAARRMIEETNFPLKLIAARCGFGCSASLRRAFLRRLGINPHRYSEQFRLTTVPSIGITKMVQPVERSNR